MSYKLNDISLSDYNIVAGRAPNSTIAVAGLFDMPKRIGKTHHSWGDHHGVEPYVKAAEIFFDGRDISFHGLIKAEDRPSAVYLLKSFYTLLNGFTDLVDFETPYGTFQVYIKDEVNVRYIAKGWCSVVLKFRQPNVWMGVNELPEGNQYQELGIDGIPFKSFGALVKKTDGNFNRPETKKQQVAAYGYEGYELTKTKLQKVKLELVFVHDSFVGLETGIHQFYTVLTAPGLRDLNMDMTGKKVFAIDGFTVKNIRIASNKAVAELSCQLVVNDMTSLYEEGMQLADNNGNLIEDNVGNAITM